MKRFVTSLALFTLFAVLILGLTMSAAAGDDDEEGWLDLEPIILESVRDGESPPIGSIALTASDLSGLAGDGDVVEIPMFMRNPNGVEGLAPAGQTFGPALGQNLSSLASANLLQVFEGAENDDNDNFAGFLLYPPDTDGDVSSDYYVQMINVVTTIFDKDGNTLLGPFTNNVFWTGLGGLCETTNWGDPIVLYDEETDRWLVSQFAFDDDFTVFSLCVAISTTGDPTGTYYQHEFDFTDIGFPDYPKYGFVTDAIGVMVNLFPASGPGFLGTGLGAIDKAEAFSDGQTTMVFFNVGTDEFGFVVGDNDGPKYNNMRPTFATNNDGMGDTIDFWEIKPKFRNPEESQIREFPPIPVSPFDGDICVAPRERCIDQPDDAPRLEAISDRLMHRLQLRNFAGSKNNRDDGNTRAVVTHTVEADGRAGIRWYEFRRHGNLWVLYQEGTYSPDTDHRWMGSIAMNLNGDICVGYSISSLTTYPSIAAACQTAAASGTGVLDTGELLIHDGEVDKFVQLGSGARWGDYSAMAIDPDDDTFWYTQEYTKPNTRLGQLAGWATKIAQLEIAD